MVKKILPLLVNYYTCISHEYFLSYCTVAEFTPDHSSLSLRIATSGWGVNFCALFHKVWISCCPML